ncbi:hypothetical protein EI94DRAFT_1713811 [Lactarius quietus]|nr:hypothetical protein EI94DRAFT_1713811 [Lactarius quietus]
MKLRTICEILTSKLSARLTCSKYILPGLRWVRSSKWDPNHRCVGNLQIARLQYHRCHFEKQPYDNSTMRSIYHIREYNVRRLALLRLSSSPDVFLSHDWPYGVEQHGDLNDSKFLALDKCSSRVDIPQRKKGHQARNSLQSRFLTTQNGPPSRELSSRTSRANANRLPALTRTLGAPQSPASGTGCTRVTEARCRVPRRRVLAVRAKCRWRPPANGRICGSARGRECRATIAVNGVTAIIAVRMFTLSSCLCSGG